MHPRPIARQPAIVCLALTLIAGCNKAQVVAPLADSGTAYVPGAVWRTAAPAAAGVDPVRLARIQADVANGRFGAIDGLVVIRFGHLIHEHYGAGWSATRSHTLQSVSKSVTGLLYGMASGGSAAALDLKVVDVMSRYAPIANRDGNKDALTMRHLLTMRTSMDYWEQPYPDSPHDSLNRSRDDWTRFILGRRMTGTPGTTWAYNSGAAILTCSVIREIAREPVVSYARRELLAPLGITSGSWFVSPFDSLPHCGGGLSLSPPDLARIGYLVLRRGKWGDKQLVPEAWIATMVQPVTTGSSIFFASHGAGYGYFWWLFPETRNGAGHGVYAGSGSGGQWLFVIPSKDLVIAVAASDGNGLDLLYDLLGALR
jgi:CubicO group peptidase (beta-lactamase class C family)